MPDSFLLPIVLGMFVGLLTMLVFIFAAIGWLGLRLKALERAWLVRPATDAEMETATLIDRAAGIDPAHPWRTIINEERRRQ